MSKVKTLPAGHLYASQPAPHHHHQHLALGHDAGSPYKRAGPLSPPLGWHTGLPLPTGPDPHTLLAPAQLDPAELPRCLPGFLHHFPVLSGDLVWASLCTIV
ncbi:hypothetical protein MTO96_005891 [Rhipicephalus appendiculatus]